MSFLKIASLIIALSLSICANAAVIDFQSLEHIDNVAGYHGFSYAEDGFTLNALEPHPLGTQLHTFGTLMPRYRGSTALIDGEGGGVIELVSNSGSIFNLYSIDIAELNYPQPSEVTNITFTGEYFNGGIVSQTFTLDGFYGVGFGFETFNFQGFTGLTRVTWTQEDPYHQFDNIYVSTVPIPAAIWLFGAGFISLVGLALKNT